jgi:hypothetical protein
MWQDHELFWKSFPSRGKTELDSDQIVAIKVTDSGDLALYCELLDYGNSEVLSYG